jgi:DNA-binding NarL/FixJ family response regulator
MLSASDDPDEVIGALDCGASAWVVKGAGIDVLMHAAQEVLHGRMYLSPATVRPVVTRLLRRREPRPRTFVDDLTERQLDVLRCLVAGMSRDETARRLFITTNTVRTHAQALLRAADEHSTPALAAKARRLGVTGIDEPDADGARSSR